MTPTRDVARNEFIARWVRAIERAAFHDGRSFLFGIEPLADNGFKCVLHDADGKIRTLIHPRNRHGLKTVRWGKIGRGQARNVIAHYFRRFLSADLRSKNPERAYWFHFRAPYCVQRHRDVPGEPTLWLPLNRLYMPLVNANFTAGAIDYEDFRAVAIPLGRDANDLVGVWKDFVPEDHRHWLYNDGPKSRRDYLNRLFRLDDAIDRGRHS